MMAASMVAADLLLIGVVTALILVFGNPYFALGYVVVVPSIAVLIRILREGPLR